jgi:predicted nucleic acid-binding protein
MTPDVNVLIAAFRRDHQHHAVALQWLDGARVACAEGRASLALLPMVIIGFLRLVTNRRVFIEPDSVRRTRKVTVFTPLLIVDRSFTDAKMFLLMTRQLFLRVRLGTPT